MLETTNMIIERINEAMKLRKTNAGQIGDALNARSKVYEILNGRSKNPGVHTVAAIAGHLGTSVAYLLGETDDPTPSAPLRKSGQSRPVWVVRSGAGASFAMADRPALALTLEDAEGVESGFVLPEGEARILHDRMARGLQELAEAERSEPSIPSSA